MIELTQSLLPKGPISTAINVYGHLGYELYPRNGSPALAGTMDQHLGGA